MLISAKPQLESDLKQALYDSAYQALLVTFSQSSENEAVINDFAKTEIDQSAKDFAKKFSDLASKPVAEAIYNFVLEIGIMASPKGTLMAPPGTTGGPVTGVINMNDFIVK